jgi:hypothetical protein
MKNGPVKRYVVFAYSNYYPAGGWGDFEGAFASVEEAKNRVLELDSVDWWQVVDSKTLEVIENHFVK